MFIDDEVPLEVGLDAARAGLANLAVSDGLISASEDAYGEGVTELIRVGPLGSGPGMSKLVRVRFQDLTERGGSAGLAVRWEATGPGGGLFPALDANVTVSAVDERTAVLRLAGSYRPPLGTLGTALDAAILHRVATATIRTFLNDIAAAITHPSAGRSAAH
jgi:hypothetical protein